MNINDLNKYISTKNKDNNKEMFYILETSVKSFLRINKRHLNMFLNNNINLSYFKKTEILGNILNINYIIKENDIKINIYENIRNQNIIPDIKKVEDLYKYLFISISINNNNQKIHNIFNIEDFKIMIKDIKSMVSLKILLNIKNINIIDIFPEYNPPPLELFYNLYFLENKKDQIINENYKIIVKFYPKYNKIRYYKNSFFWKLIKKFK